MDATYVAAVVITGLTVVFLTLVLLVICFTIFGKVFSSKKKSDDNNSASSGGSSGNAQKQTANTAQSSSSPNVMNASAKNQSEIVAVISAAVAAFGFSEGKQYEIKSIRRQNNKIAANQSAWAAAALHENTAPF